MQEEKLIKLVEDINNSQGGLKIKIKVCANSKKNSYEFLDENEGEKHLKIKVNKPAVDGKANKAIIEYLSELLHTPKNNITIISGEKSSQKCLLIRPKSNIIK